MLKFISQTWHAQIMKTVIIDNTGNHVKIININCFQPNKEMPKLKINYDWPETENVLDENHFFQVGAQWGNVG